MLLVILIAAVVVLVVLSGRPVVGLCMVLVANQFEFFAPMGGTITLGRLTGALVALVWIFREAPRRFKGLSRHWRSLVVPGLLLLTALAGIALGREPLWGLQQWIRLAMMLFLSVLIGTSLKERRDLWIFVTVAAIAFAFTASVPGLQYRVSVEGGEGFGVVNPWSGGTRFSGFRDNSNAIGAAAMSAIPLLVFLIQAGRRGWQRTLFTGVFFASTLGLLLSMSRTHIVGFVIFIIVYATQAWKGGQRLTRLASTGVVLVVGALMAFAIAPDYLLDRFTRTIERGPEGEVRYFLLLKAFDIVTSYPVFGIGYRNYRYHEPLAGYDAHDTISVVLGELGLVGAVLFAATVGATLIAQRRAIDEWRKRGDRELATLSVVIHAAFIALMAASLGTIVIVRWVFWILLGLTWVLSPPAARQAPPVVRARARAGPLPSRV